jgi:broad specificity phosphatase PhoE
LKIVQGQSNNTDLESPYELSELGYIQSVLLAKKLENINFDEIIMSDLKRAKATGEEIIKLNKNENVKIMEDPLLREKHCGFLQGKPSGILRILANVIYIIIF